MGYRAIPEMRKSKAREMARLTECFPRKHSLGCNLQDPTKPGVITPVISELCGGIVEKGGSVVKGHFWLDSDC